MLVFAVTMTSCGGGGLPNGRYAPVSQTAAMASIQAIIIDGDNFTMVMPYTGQGITVKYKYTNGTLTFAGAGAALGVACEFRNDTLFYSDMPFKRTN